MCEKLYLEIKGLGQPLIMLHGWGWHSGIWEPLVSQLAEHFQLFLIDLPGFGKSPPLTNSYSFENIVSEIFKVVPHKALWLGWSLGGLIAYWVAIHFPEKVSRLITVASSPKFIADQHWPGVTRETLNKFEQSLTQNYYQTLEDFFELQLRGSPKNETLTRVKEQIYATPPAHPVALAGGLTLLRDTDLRPLLHRIQCPSLHIYGSHDVLIPSAIAGQLSILLPTSEHVIFKRTGHIPFLTHSESFLCHASMLLAGI